MADERVSFSIDALFETISTIVQFNIARLSPIFDAINSIIGDGSAGFIIVFAIFFSLYILRLAVASKNAGAFGVGLNSVGRFGLKLTFAYSILLLFEYFLLPLLVFIFVITTNSIAGNAPNFSQTYELFTKHPDTSERIVLDILAIYMNPDRIFLPFGWRTMALLGAAFGSMLLIGRAFTPPPTQPEHFRSPWT